MTLAFKGRWPIRIPLAKLFGNAPLVWIRMQGAYDAWHAFRDVNVTAVPTLNADAANAATPEAKARRSADWPPDPDAAPACTSGVAGKRWRHGHGTSAPVHCCCSVRVVRISDGNPVDASRTL